MIEVTVRLQFTNHSLGGVQQKRQSMMLRDPANRVMFLPTWWASLMQYAAKVINRHQGIVDQIDWDPSVVGEPRLYRRYYGPSRYTIHEAFFPGDEILVNAVIPAELPLANFRHLLDVAGRYRGISHYKPKEKWGTFAVLSVERRHRALEPQPVENNELLGAEKN